jgi:hypothetical protein
MWFYSCFCWHDDDDDDAAAADDDDDVLHALGR